MGNFIDKAIKSHIIVANNKVYYIHKVDCDEEILYCHDVEGVDFIIDAHMIALSHDVRYYEELK